MMLSEVLHYFLVRENIDQILNADAKSEGVVSIRVFDFCYFVLKSCHLLLHTRDLFAWDSVYVLLRRLYEILCFSSGEDRSHGI